MHPISFRLAAAGAFVGVLGWVGAACGSTSPPRAVGRPGPTPSARAPVDTVFAITALTGVGTTISIDPSTLSALTSRGVTPSAYGTAKLVGTSVGFPVTSGYIEFHSDRKHVPDWIEGSIEHDGSGLTLTKGSISITASDFVVDPGNSMLYATVAGHPGIPLLALDETDVKVSAQNGDAVLNGIKAELTGPAATALNGAFSTAVVQPGLVLGTVRLVASGTVSTYTDKVGEISRLSGGSTTLALDSSTRNVLTSLGVALGTTGSAILAGSSISFPITGGITVIHSDKSYRPSYVDGVLLHQESGLTLTKGSTEATLTNLVVDPSNSELYGEVDGVVFPHPLANLDSSGLQVRVANGDIYLNGAVAKLSSYAAQDLDRTFATRAVTAGMPLGVLHIVASGR